MSRINTQDERLLRGERDLEQQRSFLVQPRRFQASGSGLRGLGQALGVLGNNVIQAQLRIDAEASRVEAENKKAIFNETMSGLLEGKQLLDNTDTDDEDAYSAALKNMHELLASAEEQFPEDTDDGVTIRRSFGAVSGLELFEKNRVRLAEEARRGATIQGMQDRLAVYDSAEAKDEFSKLSTEEARNLIFLDLVQGWDSSVLGEMTEQDRGEIMDLALKGANKSATLRASRLQEEEEQVVDAAAQGAAILIKSGIGSYQDVHNMASASDVRSEEMYLKVATHLADDIIAMVDSGEDMNELSNRVNRARSFADQTGSVAVVDEINGALDNYYALSATQDVSLLNTLGREQYITGADLPTLMAILNSSGVDMFEYRFGRSTNVETIADINPLNDLEKGYLTEMNRKFGDIKSNEGVKMETVGKALKVLTSPGTASRSETSALLNLDQDSRARVLAAVEGNTDLLQSEKDTLVLDNAKWSEFVGDSLRDQTGYRQGFQTFVNQVLEGDNPSHDELRGALAYAGIDPLDSARHFDNARTQYAFAEVQREVQAQWSLVPEGPLMEDFVLSGLVVEDLTSIYSRGLDEYDSFRVKVGGDGVPISGLFDNKDFIEGLTGDRNASIPDSVRDKFLSLVDISAIEDGTQPKAVAAHITKIGRELGLYFTTTQDNSGRRLPSVMSNRNSPEGIGLDRKKFQKVLNESSSRATQYIGTTMNQHYGLPGTPDFHDIAMEAINRNSTILPEDYASVLDRQELQGLIRQERVFFDVLPQVGNASQGSPVLMYMQTNQGNYVTLPLGFIDFTGPTGLSKVADIQSKTFYQKVLTQEEKDQRTKSRLERQRSLDRWRVMR